jgi:hypothetical protein
MKANEGNETKANERKRNQTRVERAVRFSRQAGTLAGREADRTQSGRVGPWLRHNECRGAGSRNMERMACSSALDVQQEYLCGITEELVFGQFCTIDRAYCT